MIFAPNNRRRLLGWLLAITAVSAGGWIVVQQVIQPGCRLRSGEHAAQRTAIELRNAIGMYFTEFKRLPRLPIDAGGGDSRVQTDAPSGLISILSPSPVSDPRMSRRSMVFFADRQAPSPSDPGLYRFPDGQAQLRDPWGNFFEVLMDTNYDNQIVLPTSDGSDTVYSQVIVISLGPNGVPGGTPGYKNDDIVLY